MCSNLWKGFHELKQWFQVVTPNAKHKQEGPQHLGPTRSDRGPPNLALAIREGASQDAFEVVIHEVPVE